MGEKCSELCCHAGLARSEHAAPLSQWLITQTNNAELRLACKIQQLCQMKERAVWAISGHARQGIQNVLGCVAVLCCARGGIDAFVWLAVRIRSPSPRPPEAGCCREALGSHVQIAGGVIPCAPFLVRNSRRPHSQAS